MSKSLPLKPLPPLPKTTTTWKVSSMDKEEATLSSSTLTQTRVRSIRGSRCSWTEPLQWGVQTCTKELARSTTTSTSSTTSCKLIVRTEIVKEAATPRPLLQRTWTSQSFKPLSLSWGIRQKMSGGMSEKRTPLWVYCTTRSLRSTPTQCTCTTTSSTTSSSCTTLSSNLNRTCSKFKRVWTVSQARWVFNLPSCPLFSPH